MALRNLTADEVASRLGISRSTLQRRIQEGDIKPLTPYNPMLKRQRLVFSEDEVDRVLQRAHTEAVPSA